MQTDREIKKASAREARFNLKQTRRVQAIKHLEKRIGILDEFIRNYRYRDGDYNKAHQSLQFLTRVRDTTSRNLNLSYGIKPTIPSIEETPVTKAA